MKVALVAPPSEKGKYEHGNQSLPKIGLGYLASMLEKESIQCEIIDAKFERRSLDEVLARLRTLKPDLVGLTAMTPDICDAALVAHKVKSQDPKCWTIVGGPHAMALPRETMEEFHEFDLLIAGEGEYALVEVVRALEENRSMDTIAGVAFRKDGQVCVNPLAPWINDLDALPFPAWSKYPSRSDVYYVLSVRGCPFRCVFCMRSMGRTPRRRSPENVVQEIQWLVEQHHAKEFIFIDETFGLNREHVTRMFALLTDKGLHRRIRWTAQTRVDRVDEELLQSMRHAGCYRVEFGIESGNQKILDAVQKGTTLAQAEVAVRIAKKSGLQVGCSFILGHPHETKETAQDTIDFLAKLNPHTASIGIMIPHPGTEVHEMAIKGEGDYVFSAKSWSQYVKFGGGGLELKNLPRRSLERLQAKSYLTFYLRNHRYWDFLKYAYSHRRQAFVAARRLIPYMQKPHTVRATENGAKGDE